MTRAKMGVKLCARCGKTLPVSEFSQNKRAKDGLQKYCKSCMQSYHIGANEDEKRMLIREILDRLKIFREGDLGEINDTVRKIREKNI